MLLGGLTGGESDAEPAVADAAAARAAGLVRSGLGLIREGVNEVADLLGRSMEVGRRFVVPSSVCGLDGVGDFDRGGKEGGLGEVKGEELIVGRTAGVGLSERCGRKGGPPGRRDPCGLRNFGAEAPVPTALLLLLLGISNPGRRGFGGGTSEFGEVAEGDVFPGVGSGRICFVGGRGRPNRRFVFPARKVGESGVMGELVVGVGGGGRGRGLGAISGFGTS